MSSFFSFFFRDPLGPYAKGQFAFFVWNRNNFWPVGLDR